MNAAYFRTLFDYSAWARKRLLAAVEQISDDEYFAARPLDYGSIHGTLVHTYAPEAIWLRRWHGVSPERMLDAGDVSDLAGLKRRWSEAEAQIATFLDATSDEQIATSVVDYVSTEGDHLRRPLWQTMAQLINHGTHHRSEVANVVTQLGHSPGDLDLIVFFNLQDG
jgi:uncharacterized damage-inducible protein DinB